MSARTQARRGAAWLDKKVPGWAKRIKITQLRMDESCNCIIGQLEGDYFYGAVRLGIRDPHGSVAISRGLKPQDDYETQELNKAWKAEVRTRR